MEESRTTRLKLADMNLSIGKRVRLHRLLYRYGPANGTLLLLPIDQGLEHGPRDFAPNPASANPEFQLRLAKEGGYSGIAFHIGLAEKYMRDWAGEVPVVLKVNGKTEIPSDREAFSPLTSSVEDAVRLGADAVGYTLYVGSPAQAEDFLQFNEVRREAEQLGMPVIVWAYPRGEAIETKGGRDTLYAIEYAARVACEMGADVVKLNLPKLDSSKATMTPAPYNSLDIGLEEAVRRVINAAGRTLVIFAGGGKVDDEELLGRTRLIMQSGATGLIFGRNVWQRPWDEALGLSRKIKEILAGYST
jgi:fructose-bisphosphate aldolase, class I